jgi:chromate transport protein ChrA
MWSRPRIRPPWLYLALFAAFALGLLALSAVSSSRLVQLTESFYRYGYLVFGGVGIFLPGLLLIYFVYPVWEQLKQIRAIRIALRGINAVAGGMIAIAAVILMQASGFHAENLVVTGLSVALLASRRVPAPLIVVGALAAGFVL